MRTVGDRVSIDGSTYVVIQVRGAALHESKGRHNLADSYKEDGIADLVCKSGDEEILVREKSDGTIIRLHSGSQ